MREQLIRMEAQLADYEATRLKNDRLQKEMKVMKNDLKTMTIGAAKACDANEMLRGKVRRAMVMMKTTNAREFAQAINGICCTVVEVV